MGDEGYSQSIYHDEILIKFETPCSETYLETPSSANINYHYYRPSNVNVDVGVEF